MNDDGPDPGDDSAEEDGDVETSDRADGTRAGTDGVERDRGDRPRSEHDPGAGSGIQGAEPDDEGVVRGDVEASDDEPGEGEAAPSDADDVGADDAPAVEAADPPTRAGRDDVETAVALDRGGAAVASEVDGERAPARSAREGSDAPPGPEADGPAARNEDVHPEPDDDVPDDVSAYDRFQKVDRASYDRVNEFLRDRTYITAREWAIARLCADFRTATGVEMTKIGENLPELVPFMTDTYSPQAVNQARSAFEEKVRMAGATFLYGAMSGFFTADELDEVMYEVTEVAKFLLEVEGVELTVDEELDAEDRISAVMREVRRASEELRFDEVACPHCGEAFQPAED